MFPLPCFFFLVWSDRFASPIAMVRVVGGEKPFMLNNNIVVVVTLSGKLIVLNLFRTTPFCCYNSDQFHAILTIPISSTPISCLRWHTHPIPTEIADKQSTASSSSSSLTSAPRLPAAFAK